MFTQTCQNLHSSGHCRNLRFTIDPIHGKRLENHVIQTIDVINEDICQLKCYLEPNCVSYNFNKNEENGKHKCDLNNATYEHGNEHSGDLAKKQNYVYQGAEVDIEVGLYNIVKMLFCCFYFFAALINSYISSMLRLGSSLICIKSEKQ